MKRIHLVEIEDLHWFPGSLRQCMTRLIIVMHKLLGSQHELTKLISRALNHADRPAIIDLCSGSGGPMVEVFKRLKTQPRLQNLTLTLTDLYPHQETADQINSKGGSGINYLTKSVNAGDLDVEQVGVRTMVCSMHHMKPEVAHNILSDAKAKRQPICLFELSDNSFPIRLWWMAIPMIFLLAFFITPLVKPMTWRQLVFTYLVPIIPICFAWDGAVSNARTYTLADMDELLKGLQTSDYVWEKGKVGGMLKKLYLLGLPMASPRQWPGE
jgi:hypothetical protein